VRAESGAGRLGIEHFGPVVTRGVLLDVARAHGVDHFDDNYAITGDDLERAACAAGVVVEAGDALLVRTGHMHFLRTGDKQRYSMPSPGLSTKSIEYLRDHDVAAVATDTMTFEVYPCEDPSIFMPVHMIQLRDMGLVQGQNWFLDDLAADCADDTQYDFLLVAPPLPLTGAVGAPVVPVAIK
jgi:kynurenine formamidase